MTIFCATSLFVHFLSNRSEDIQKQDYSYLRHYVLHLTAGLVGAIVIAKAVQHLLILELVLV